MDCDYFEYKDCFKYDDDILPFLFPDKETPTVTDIVQSRTECTFIATFPYHPDRKRTYDHPVEVTIKRKSKKWSQFDVDHVIRMLAGHNLVPCVPRVILAGVFGGSEGEPLEVCLEEHKENSVRLRAVWEKMSTANRNSVVDKIASVVRELHFLRISMIGNQGIIPSSMPLAQWEAGMGGPRLGFHEDAPSFLAALGEEGKMKEQAFVSMETLPGPEGDIVLRSLFGGVNDLVLKNACMRRWVGESVLCHNNITPSTVMLRKTHENPPTYEVVALTRWEHAGFYPASHELASLDMMLGHDHRDLSFYMMLKSRLRPQVLVTESQVAFLRAVSFIFEASEAQQRKGKQFTAIYRQKYLTRMQLRMSGDDYPYGGWIGGLRDANGEYPQLTTEEIDSLIDETCLACILD